MLPSQVALRNSVISHPPANSTMPGPLVFDVVRGPLLPARGTKERDRILRIFDQNDYASNWQGATSGILKKASQTRIQINGPTSKVQYYQDLIGTAHQGKGWEHNVKLGGRDYLTQSYGWFEEIAGPGDPSTPLLEAPTGINHLDAGRCYVTGNPIYPVLYYDLWSGKLHKMHATRVYWIVDDPNPDERYLGIGRCALERAIAIAQREIRMGQYIDALLDDKPQPGILSLTGVSDNNWNAKVVQYMTQQGNDERPVFGRTMVLTSLDPNAKVSAEVIPFSQTPEKFDWIKYMDADLSNYALAIGVDRQELAELSGKALGSGAQSETLSNKSLGKFYGDFYAHISRFLNWAVLPDDCEATVVEDDAQEKEVIANIDTQYSAIATSLNGIGVPTEVIMKMLAAVSPTFEQAFTDEQGNIIALPKPAPQLAPGQAPDTPTTSAAQPQSAGVDNSTPVPDKTSVGTKGTPVIDQTRAQQQWFFANNPQFGSGSSDMPKLQEGFTYGKTIAPHELAKGDIFYHPGNSRHGTMSGTITKVNPKTIAYERHSDYSGAERIGGKWVALEGPHMDHYSSRHEEFYGGYVSRGNKIHPLNYVSTGKPKSSQFPEGTMISDGLITGRVLGQGMAGKVPVYRIRTNSGKSEFIPVGQAQYAPTSIIDYQNRFVNKAYSSTSADFATRFTDIVTRAIDGRLRRNQAENLMLGLLNSSGTKAFMDGLAEGGVYEMDIEDRARVQNWLFDTIDYIDPFLDSAFDGTLPIEQVSNRALMWTNKSLEAMRTAGRLSADRNGMYVFVGNDGKENCNTCKRLKGQVHRFKDWERKKLVPRLNTDTFDCKGFECKHRLAKTTGKAMGNF